jgi:hypothetical protein
MPYVHLPTPHGLLAQLVVKEYVKNFHRRSLLDYAPAVEKVTISKKDVVRCPLLFFKCPVFDEAF